MIDRCESTINPGRWPYVTRCRKAKGHTGSHKNEALEEWEDEEEGDDNS
jgi:hypothetical protein